MKQQIEAIYEHGTFWIRSSDVIKILYMCDQDNAVKALREWIEDKEKLIDKQKP